MVGGGVLVIPLSSERSGSVRHWHAVAVSIDPAPVPVSVPRPVLAAFGLAAADTVEPLGAGHIHQTFRVAGDTVVQRLNGRVFADLDQLMANRERITAHLRRCRPEWADRSPVRAETGALMVEDPPTGRWRAHPFVPGTVPGHDADLEDLRAAGAAFGAYLTAMQELDPPPVETISGFHDLGHRRRALADAVATDRAGRAVTSRTELERARDLEPVLAAIADLIGGLPVRTVHNDAKLANVVLDPRDRTPRAILDLDTTMAGTVVADLGELVRSSVSATAEDRSAPSRTNVVDPQRFAAIVAGYLAGCGDRLTADERSICTWAGPLLSYENGIRYLADHLDGDRYFAIDRAGHNLERARAQLSLTEDLVEAQDDLTAALASAI